MYLLGISDVSDINLKSLFGCLLAHSFNGLCSFWFVCVSPHNLFGFANHRKFLVLCILLFTLICLVQALSLDFFWFLQSIENFCFFVFCLFTFDIFGSCSSIWIFIVNLACFCICFSGMRRWSRRWSRFDVLVLCFVDVRAKAETEALADGISVSLVSVGNQY